MSTQQDTNTFDENTVNKLAAKGHRLYDAISEAITNQRSQPRALPSLHEKYKINIDLERADDKFRDKSPQPRTDNNDASYEGYSAHIRKIFSENDTPTEGYANMKIKCEGCDKGPAYINSIHKSGQALLCIANFSSYDPLRTNNLPGQMWWSDLIAIAIEMTMAETNGDPTTLQKIWRVNVINEKTNCMIDQARNDPSTDTKKECFVLTPDSEYFFALLGTDNGAGIARMLATYPHMFGGKTISKVQVYDQGTVYMCWYLQVFEMKEPTPPPPPPESTTLSRKERRHKNRSSRRSASGTTNNDTSFS